MKKTNNKEGRLVVSVSGGKDSTATCLHLLEQGYTRKDFDRIFFDTGWEEKRTYQYLDELEKTIGPIKRLRAEIPIKEEYREHIEYFETRLGHESPMIRNIFRYLNFPRRFVRWCTRELKIAVANSYFESLEDEYINVVGIRKEESKSRSLMEEWEFNNHFDCWVWRPLINWTEKQVIDIHHRFNLAPNPLYLQGSLRVGCYPCINSNKKEIKHLSLDRIQLIEDLEQTITKLKQEKTGKQKEVTFFQIKGKDTNFSKIRNIYQWSLTTRGGSQYELFSKEAPTCIRWGMCNT